MLHKINWLLGFRKVVGKENDKENNLTSEKDITQHAGEDEI